MLNSELKEKILDFMRREAYAPLDAEDLLQATFKDGDVNQFWALLLELEENGDVIKTRFNTYGLPEKMGLVVGRFQLTTKGFGFVIPDNKNEQEDVFIPPRAVGGAMNNDRVMARIERKADKRPEGEIIRIIKRNNDKVVGLFRQTGDFAFVVPDDKHIGRDIYVMRKNFGGAKDNQKVMVEITQWPTERRNAEGKVVEILGNMGDVGLEILSIIKQNGLPLEFPPEVIEASKKVPSEIDPKEITGRKDLRDLKIVTIDGDDAKDLDDAVYVKQIDENTYMLGVYIADVSYYVKENSILDKEALDRATSVYLVDRVLPMLPERLSNGICSLNAGVDRLVMGCEMKIDITEGKVTSYEIFPGVINVCHRLSYRIVREILVNEDVEFKEQYADVLPMLREMEKLSLALKKKRFKRGAIDFDLPEQKILLDEVGKPIEIVPRVRSIAESIIEEFMLAANETVARHMFDAKWPFVYRIHDLPAEDKMQNLARLLNNFNVHLPVTEEMHPLEIQKALAQMAGKPEERLISTVALRCLRQAIYQTENIGHFGLAAEYYTHFTSPIRRYPDLLVHRMLRRWLNNPVITEEAKEKLEISLEDMAQHSSIKERDAAEAERATLNLKKAEYMVDHIGEEFEGTISSVTAFGMFVELPNGVEGLVHISSLTDDYYDFHEDQYALIGTHTKKQYRLGDTVKIEVLQVNIAERTIDFIMAGENEAMRQKLREQLAGRNGIDPYDLVTTKGGTSKRTASSQKPRAASKLAKKDQTSARNKAGKKPKKKFFVDIAKKKKKNKRK